MKKGLVCAFVIFIVITSFLSVNAKIVSNPTYPSNDYFFNRYWNQWTVVEEYGNYGEIIINPEETNATWTLIAYLDGDNNLEAEMINIFNQFEIVGSTENVKIVVQIDRSDMYDTSNGNWDSMRRYFVTKDENGFHNTIVSELLVDLGEQNVGDPQVLQEFVDWSIDNYPSDHYCLFLADHGAAWEGVLIDWENDFDILTMEELKTALNNIYNSLGKKLDIISFNACAMGSLEVYNQIKDYANIAIGSEDFQYGTLKYGYFTADLANNPSWSATRFAKEIVNDTSTIYPVPVKDIAAIDLNKIDTVVVKTSVFADFLKEISDSDANLISDIIYSSVLIEFYSRTELADLWDFANETQNYFSDQDLKNSAQDVKDSIDSSVIAHYSIDLDMHRPGHGISINLIDESSILDDDFYQVYCNLDFSYQFYWDDFLLSYYTAEKINSPPSLPIITGPKEGKIGAIYTYTASSKDPERQYVHYKFSLGDGSETPWLGRGSDSYNYKWKKAGTFEVKVKAIDEPYFDYDLSDGAESEWAILSVAMPKNRVIGSFLLKYIVYFPHIAKVFWHLI